MSKFTVRALLFGVGVFAISFLGVAFAYILIGHDWTYQSFPMGENYVVFENTDDTVDELAAILAAAAKWNEEPADFYFYYGGPGTHAAPAFDGINQIRWGITAGSLATTTFWYNATTGDILEVDCVLNDNLTWSVGTPTPAGQYDVESIMLHQFGHYLSIGHSTPPAIMQPTVPSGTQRRLLTVDDQYGIESIYGTAACAAIGPSAKIITLRPSQAVVNLLLLFSPILLVITVRTLSKRERRK